MKIIPISKPSRDAYECAPCWLDHQREVMAQVLVQEGNEYTKRYTAMCGNHAEMVSNKQQEKGK